MEALITKLYLLHTGEYSSDFSHRLSLALARGRGNIDTLSIIWTVRTIKRIVLRQLLRMSMKTIIII